MNLWSLTVMSEVLFTFLLAIAIMIFLIALEKSSGFASCFAGVLLGLATLTRPIGLVIVGLWVLIYLLASFARWSPGLNFRLGIGFILGCATVILPWMARNAAAHQRFVVSDIGSHTLESFNFAIVLSEAEDITRNEATYILGDVGGTWDQFRWIISKYPVDFLRSQIAGASRVLGGTEITRWATVSGRENWDGFGVFRNLRKGEFGAGWENLVDTLQTPAERWLLFIYLLSILHTVVLVLLSIVCLASFSRFDVNRRFLILFCIGTSLGLILMSGAAGQARFRVPVEPMLAMTAGLGALKLARRRGKKVFEQ